MNLIEKALRYIYIYILTSKAGLEYDLQSREVWRGKREDKRSNHQFGFDKQMQHLLLGCGRGIPHRTENFDYSYFAGQLANFVRYTKILHADRDGSNQSRNHFNDYTRISRRRLTSKGVAA